METNHNAFLLKPAAKDYLWGGNRLNEDFNKNIDMSPLAETWECSTHPDGTSVVSGGEYDGLPLSDVLAKHQDMLGKKYEKIGELPILIKFIDAKQDLSVQVHPDDMYAFTRENGQLGKTEMWYLVDADKNASLVFGLNRDMDKEAFRKAAEDGTLECYLNRVMVKKGDSFFIEPGTIHAIGAGCLIAEIQENSNLTYRIYDYNRRDKNGNKRQLHLDKALDVSKLSAVQPKDNGQGKSIDGFDRICSCNYFSVDRLAVADNINISVTKMSFQVLLCLEGDGCVDGLNFKKGDCIFVPAGDKSLKITGKAVILRTVC